MQVCRLQTLERAAVLAFAIVMVCATAASANEVQLAGIRLGQHALRLMQVYGQPDGIVKGGAAQAQTPTGGQGAMGAQAGEMAGAAGAPGMAGGGPGGMPGGAPGGAPGGMPGMAGGMPGGMGAGMGAEAGMGAGAPGAAAGGAAAGQTGGSAAPRGGSVGGPPPGPFSFFSGNIPNWALPVWIPMVSGESLWVYRKGAVVMGFVLDRDGYVLAIAVAGEKCDWARTAMWAPKRSVKLGDTFQTVINRYGYPEGTAGYRPTEVSWLGSGRTAGTGGIQNAYRDVTLHYGAGENVEFLLRNMKVVRIHIWEPEARPPAMRATTAAAGGAGGGGMMGPMGAEGAAGPAG